VTLVDGQQIRLGDLPIKDPLCWERSAATPPFSFSYGDRHSDEFLATWKFREERDTSQPGRTSRVRTYTDPQTGLVVRSTVVEYADFPTVEWTLSFKNFGDHDTPILAGILPLDTRFERGEEVRSPLVVLQFYRGDWTGAQNVWRSWMLEHNVPRRNGKTLQPFMFVCNGGYYPGLMTAAAAELQFLRRYFVIRDKPGAAVFTYRRKK